MIKYEFYYSQLRYGIMMIYLSHIWEMKETIMNPNEMMFEIACLK